MEDGVSNVPAHSTNFQHGRQRQGEAMDVAVDGGGVAAERVSSPAELFASSSEIDILLRFESSSSALWTCVKSSNEKCLKRKVRLLCPTFVCCGGRALAHTNPFVIV